MSRPAKGRGPSHRQRPAPLRLEPLEDRTLLSVAPVPLDLSGLRVDTNSFDPTRILVRFQDGATPTPLLAGTSLGHALAPVPGLYEVLLGSGVGVSDALAAYRASAAVALAEPDYTLSVQKLPNDPSFAQQWDLKNTGQSGGTALADIHAVLAWDVTTGSTKITVAVMDTGIDFDHPDLVRNVWLNQAEIPLSRRANLIDTNGDGLITFADLADPRNQGFGKITDVNQDGRIDGSDVLSQMIKNAQGVDTGWGGWADGVSQDGDKAHLDDLVGWNFVNNTNRPFDDNGHGTHVSGTIGAAGDNATGVTGIAWNTQVMGIKWMDSAGFGSVGAFIDGLNYSLLHGAKITNNSWSGASNSQVLLSAIDAARAKGQIFVAAAGNSGVNTDVVANQTFPADFALDNVVTVAATDRLDNLAIFSNYGVQTVDLAAPGSSILSTTPNSTYSIYSGTSMAVPHVAAAMALVWGLHPTWTYRQVIDQILHTVDPLPALQGKVQTGGRLDIAKAVGAVVDNTSPQVVGAFPSGAVLYTLDHVRVTFNKAIDPTTLKPTAITLTSPTGTAIPITAIQAVGTTNTVFDLVFGSQSAAGGYTFLVGTAVHDQVGHPLSLYRTTFTLASVRTFTSTQVVAIPDVNKASSAITITQDFLLAHVQVTLNIQHTYDSDLYIHLTAPNGTDILLSNRRGGAGDNYLNTVFDDNATTSIRTGAAPFAGTFQPEAQLLNLNGISAKGTWKLWVEDRAGGDVGTLKGWSMVLTAVGGAGTAAAGVQAERGSMIVDVLPAAGRSNAAFVLTGEAATALGSIPGGGLDGRTESFVWLRQEGPLSVSGVQSASSPTAAAEDFHPADAVFQSAERGPSSPGENWLTRLSGGAREDGKPVDLEAGEADDTDDARLLT